MIYHKPSVSIISIETGALWQVPIQEKEEQNHRQPKCLTICICRTTDLSELKSIEIFGRMKQIILTTSGLMKGRNLNKAHPIFRVM